MNKFRLLFGAVLLTVAISVISHHDASAWYNKDGNCYKTQYYLKYKGSYGKDGTKTSEYEKKVYSTNKICYKNGKLTTGVVSNVMGSGLKYPQYSKGKNDKEIKVTYCQNGPIVNQWLNLTGSNELKEYNSCSKGTKTETFTMKDGESFKNFTARINTALASKPIQSNTSIIDANKSDAKNEGYSITDENGNKTTFDGGRCKGNAAAKALGWVLCPILEFMGDASDGVYNKFVEPLLQISPTLFSGSEDEGIRGGWETFRNFANIIFVILLLFVIFSQVTGVGIDNYGIKKILPKLIIAAVLINLSYILCILAVDISNIVGNGLQALFNTLSDGLDPATSLEIEGDTIDISEITTSAVSGVALLGAVVAGGALLFANPAILLSLLVGALGIVVSIFFLFILLTARQAAVIVLTVISPIAVVMYALPNTKSLFDKWLKIFEGLLLVYPIAGLLVGAGNYVSRLLLVSGLGEASFVAALTAMIVSVIPIFFIPIVLKQSFAALGNLGSKISGIGQRIGGAAQGAARGSAAYQMAQEAGRMRQTRIRAGVNADGSLQDTSGMGKWRRMRVARNRGQYLQDQAQLKAADRLTDGPGMDAALIGQQKRAEAEEVADYMTLINNNTQNGADGNGVVSMFDNYVATKNKAGAVAAAKVAGRRKDTASKFMDNTIKDGSKKYDEDTIRSVSKEMTEGESAANYRAGSPLGFEYASAVNNGSTTAPYSDFIKNSENVKNAVEHHVTNSSELVGVQKSNLQELNNLMEDPDNVMPADQANRLRKLAQETIANRENTGVWDSTKTDEIYRMAYGKENYQNQMAQDGFKIEHNPN